MARVIKQAYDHLTDWLYNYSASDDYLVENSVLDYEYKMKAAQRTAYTVRRNSL